VDHFRFLFDYPFSRGRNAQSHRSGAGGVPDRPRASTLVIAAAVICAVRLARDNIDVPNTRVLTAVADSVTLAKMILKRVVGR